MTWDTCGAGTPGVQAPVPWSASRPWHNPWHPVHPRWHWMCHPPPETHHQLVSSSGTDLNNPQHAIPPAFSMRLHSSKQSAGFFLRMPQPKSCGRTECVFGNCNSSWKRKNTVQRAAKHKWIHEYQAHNALKIQP